jgi:hypothetical protein
MNNRIDDFKDVAACASESFVWDIYKSNNPTFLSVTTESLHLIPRQKMSTNMQQQSTSYENAPHTFFRYMQNAVCVGEFSKDDSKFSF